MQEDLMLECVTTKRGPWINGHLKVYPQNDKTGKGVQNVKLMMAVWVHCILALAKENKLHFYGFPFYIFPKLHLFICFFIPWLTYLFLAHTPPGLHHHLDTQLMPPKYHQSFGARRTMELLFLSHFHCLCSVLAKDWIKVRKREQFLDCTTEGFLCDESLLFD